MAALQALQIGRLGHAQHLLPALGAGLAELSESLVLMGRGDKRTWRGKIFKGSFGKARRPAKHGVTGWWHRTEDAIPIPPPPPSRSAPALPEPQAARQEQVES